MFFVLFACFHKQFSGEKKSLGSPLNLKSQQDSERTIVSGAKLQTVFFTFLG